MKKFRRFLCVAISLTMVTGMVFMSGCSLLPENLTEKYNELTATIDQLNEDNQMLSDKIDELTAKNGAQIEEITKLKNEIKKSSDKIDELNETLEKFYGDYLEYIKKWQEPQPQEPQETDKCKKQIKIGVYNGGFGTEFLYDLKAKFEAKHAADTFSDGKVGVQITIVPEGATMSTEYLLTTYVSWNYDIMFANDGINYRKMIEKNELLDITDIATATLAGEGTSIDGKIRDQYKNWYKVDGKYYALPWTESGNGLVYDKTYFWDNDLYLNEAGEFAACTTDADGKVTYTEAFGKGPDGKTGKIDGVDYDADNGLPVTYADFYKVCDKIKLNGDVPITYPSALSGYALQTLTGFYADYEASAALVQGLPINTYLDARFNYQGTTDYLTFDGNVPNVQEKVEVDTQNAYKTFQQPGLYYATDWLYNVTDQTKGYTEVTEGDHRETQTAYYYSAKKGETIVFLMEGPWWYNESKRAREDFDDVYPGEAHEYGMMPFPKVSADMVSPVTFLDAYGGASAFISSRIANDSEKVALCKEFLQSAFTQASLVNFTQKTSTTAPYKYTMTAEEMNKCSSFGKQMYALHTSANYVVSHRPNDIALTNPKLCMPEGIWTTKSYGGNPLSKALMAYRTVSAKDYFLDIGNFYTSTLWFNLCGAQD